MWFRQDLLSLPQSLPGLDTQHGSGQSNPGSLDLAQVHDLDFLVSTLGKRCSTVGEVKGVECQPGAAEGHHMERALLK